MAASVHMTQRRQHELVVKSGRDGDMAALAELREWWTRYPREAEHRARFDHDLQNLMRDDSTRRRVLAGESKYVHI